MDIEKYIADVQAEIELALMTLHRYEGALAMLKKIKADMQEQAAQKESAND